MCSIGSCTECIVTAACSIASSGCRRINGGSGSGKSTSYHSINRSHHNSKHIAKSVADVGSNESSNDIGSPAKRHGASSKSVSELPTTRLAMMA